LVLIRNILVNIENLVYSAAGDFGPENIIFIAEQHSSNNQLPVFFITKLAA